MGHYDEGRPGYCGGCGAAPGNMRSDGSCPFCSPECEKPPNVKKLRSKQETPKIAGTADKVKFESLQLLELFQLQGGNRAMKVGKSAFVTKMAEGTVCKVKIKPYSAVTRLEGSVAEAFLKALLAC